MGRVYPLFIIYYSITAIYFASYSDNTSGCVDGLADDEVEIIARAIQLTRTYRTASFCVYAGTISRIGTAVKIFAPNDRVVAIGAVVGASRVRVSQRAPCPYHQPYLSVMPQHPSCIYLHHSTPCTNSQAWGRLDRFLSMEL